MLLLCCDALAETFASSAYVKLYKRWMAPALHSCDVRYIAITHSLRCSLAVWSSACFIKDFGCLC